MAMCLTPLFHEELDKTNFTEFTPKILMLPDDWVGSYTTLLGSEKKDLFCVIRFYIIFCRTKFWDSGKNKNFMRDLQE